VIVALATGTLVVAVVPASALKGTHAVNGQADGSGGLAGPHAGDCSGPDRLFVHNSGTLDATTLHRSTFSLQFCDLYPPPGQAKFPVADGLIRITAPDGTLKGSLSGWVKACCAGPRFPAHIIASVVQATGRYANAQGTIVLDGYLTVGAEAIHAQVTGVLTGT
jgi:hypothetical protein